MEGRKRRTGTRRWKEVLSTQRDRGEGRGVEGRGGRGMGDEERSKAAVALSFSSSTDARGRNERCKVIKANVHHLVGDLKARNFL